MAKKLPEITSDDALETFMEGDLSGLDSQKAYPFTFIFTPSLEDLPKTENVHIRFSKALLVAVKQKATLQGISYQKYIRRVIESSI